MISAEKHFHKKDNVGVGTPKESYLIYEIICIWIGFLIFFLEHEKDGTNRGWESDHYAPNF